MASSSAVVTLKKNPKHLKHVFLLQESFSTCRFSQRVALIDNDAILNEILDPDLVKRSFISSPGGGRVVVPALLWAILPTWVGRVGFGAVCVAYGSGDDIESGRDVMDDQFVADNYVLVVLF